MMGVFVVGIVAAFTAPEAGLADVQSALGSFQRLAAAVSTEKPGASVVEKAEYSARKAELEALLTYLRKVQEVTAIGKWDASYSHNMILVAQQAVTAGKALAVLPEEELCWDRAGLNFTAVHRFTVAQQVQAGVLPAKALDQADAAYERARREYRRTLARLVENAR